MTSLENIIFPGESFVPRINYEGPCVRVGMCVCVCCLPGRSLQYFSPTPQAGDGCFNSCAYNHCFEAQLSGEFPATI